MNRPTLSPEMVDAYDLAKQNGGKLSRWAGGFWAQPGWTGATRHFGTKTVHALVTRDVAVYSEWKNGQRKSFPVEITIKPIPE